MGRLKNEITKLTGTDFFQIAKKTTHPKMRLRLLALGHLESGKTKTEVAEIFQISFPTLRSWLTRFLTEGIEGLRDRKSTGRKRKLPAAREEDFRQQVELLQESRKGGRVRGQDIQVLLKEKFCVDYALPSVYHVLDRYGFSWISARSKHPKFDPIAQEQFKKNSKKP